MKKFLTTLLVSSIFSLTPPAGTAGPEIPELPSRQQGEDLTDCVKMLAKQDGGWCEIRMTGGEPSIASVWPDNLDDKTRMIVGPRSVLVAWNSAAFDYERDLMYFTGGGHADYGGNEVYEFDLNKAEWTRLTDPSPLNYLFVAADYNSRPHKPWRRLCWMPNVHNLPGSAHTYDGLQFSSKTDTLFYFVMRAANGSCIEDQDDGYKDDPAVLGGRMETSTGWYEFNPSRSSDRNGLAPLSWRKVFDFKQLRSKSIHQSFPMTAELDDGRIVFGSKHKTVVYDPTIPQVSTLQSFTKAPADWGNGTMINDTKRNLVWTIHGSVLLGFEAIQGKLVRSIKTKVNLGYSLAIDRNDNLVSWDGDSTVYSIDPDETNPQWRGLDWASNGPRSGDNRVYGKWIYIKKHNVFAGIASHRTGFLIYRQPKEIEPYTLSNINPQTFIDRAKKNTTVVIPPGVYGRGLFINKSLTVKMQGAELRGIAKRKGIINVSCSNCNIVLEDFHGDGRKAGCIRGNCAGIKAEGVNFNLTLRRAHIDNTVMGVLTDNRGGSVTIEDSLIENTGFKDQSNTLGHSFYAGMIDKVVIRNTTIRRTFGAGHIVKSRAPDTLIENSIIAGLDGHHSRTIDFSCGGKLVIRNSTLQHSDNADNIDLISVGTEPTSCHGMITPSDVSIRNNWIIFDRDRSSDERSHNDGPNVFFNWHAPLIAVDLSDNRIVESTGTLKFEFHDRVPAMFDGNKIFSSRKAAGLGPKEIPSPPTLRAVELETF